MARHPSRSLTWFGWVVVGLGAVVATVFFAVYWSIQSGISTATEIAVRAYPGDQIVALIGYADADGPLLRERNRAVWALGQLRDRRALPMLERHYTGGACDHERGLCQKELRKAIDLIRAGN